MDFSQAQGDQIDLYGIGDSGHVGLAFLGTAGFTGGGNEIRYTTGASRTKIEIDLDGDTFADCIIILAGQHFLTADDFSL